VPKRGKPPKAPEGYEQYPGNPYKFWPTLPPCTHRIEAVKGDPNCCGGTYNTIECKVIDDLVTRLDCRNCDGNPNWISGFDRHGDVFFKGHDGIGDNIYQRPFIKAACDYYQTVYLQTPWPQVYWDLPNLKFVKTNSYFRTQKINVKKQNGWSNVPYTVAHKKELKYSVIRFREHVSILEQFNQQFPIENFQLSMPVKDEWAFDVPDKFIVVHYPTLRREWLNGARNCKPEYIQQCVDWLKKDYTVISIAHIKDSEEWFVQKPRGCDQQFHHGELSIEQVSWLLSKSSLAISPVGFILPLGWAVGCKTFIIFGGAQHPKLLTHPKFSQSNLDCIIPEPFCDCNKIDHSCNKEIDLNKLKSRLFTFLEGSGE